jgi:hypothetical protein
MKITVHMESTADDIPREVYAYLQERFNARATLAIQIGPVAFALATTKVSTGVTAAGGSLLEFEGQNIG